MTWSKTFHNEQELRSWAKEQNDAVPCWHARWTIEIPLPLPIARVRQVVEYFLGKNPDETEHERRRCLHLLLDWAISHPPHPAMPEYAGRSYLSFDPYRQVVALGDSAQWPLGQSSTHLMEKLQSQGIKVSREVRPCWKEHGTVN